MNGASVAVAMALLLGCGNPPAAARAPSTPAYPAVSPAPLAVASPTSTPPTFVLASAPDLRIDGVAPERPAVLPACTGTLPPPGQALREVNLCDLLARDRAKQGDGPDYKLVSYYYADIRPTWASSGASLCAGEEAVLRVSKTPGDGEPRDCIQLRCVASFPPQPARIGKNGEYCRSRFGGFEYWELTGGRVAAHSGGLIDTWTLDSVGDTYELIRR